jgi:hypothetical protein
MATPSSHNATTVSANQINLDCGTSYYYRVRVYRAVDGQYSGFSNIASAETAMCELKIVGYLPLLIMP